MTKTIRSLLLTAWLSVPGMMSAAVFNFSNSAITNANQITLPAGMNSLVTAVNVGSTSPSTVNGITFAADSGNWAPSNAKSNFAGNGYTARGGTEGGGGVAGADFTPTTINIFHDGYFVATPITTLAPNTDYVFQLYLTDLHAGRGGQFSLTLGGTTQTVNIAQTFGSVNRYEVSFNSGAETTFSWRLDAITNFHDSKVSGFALYSSAPAVPEPSTYALVFGAVTLGIAIWRRGHRRVSPVS
jgi:hypothetical protein